MKMNFRMVIKNSLARLYIVVVHQGIMDSPEVALAKQQGLMQRFKKLSKRVDNERMVLSDLMDRVHKCEIALGIDSFSLDTTG